MLLHLDDTSKYIIKMKIQFMGYSMLAEIFDVLYIRRRPLHEYTAMENNISIASLFRYRNKIIELWDDVKNEIMEEQAYAFDKSN